MRAEDIFFIALEVMVEAWELTKDLHQHNESNASPSV